MLKNIGKLSIQRSFLFVLFAFVCLSAVLAQQTFVAKEFFLGDWQLESHRTHLADPTHSEETLAEVSAWKIKDGNLTLFGTYIDEKEEERPIHVEFDSEREGRFALALPEEEDHVVIFEFHFENRSAGYFISQGAWKDEHRSETGTYQLFVTSPQSFILNIVLKNPEGHFADVLSITGKKYVEKEAPGFLQRFGMPLTLFGVLMVSQFFKGRQAGQQPQPEAPAAGTRRREDEEPKITEIQDDEDEGKKEK